MPTMYEIRKGVATAAAVRTATSPSAAAASPATPIPIGTRRSTSTSLSSLTTTSSNSSSDSSVDFDDMTVPANKSSGYRKSRQKAKKAGSKRKAARQGRSSSSRIKAGPQAAATASIPAIGDVGYKFKKLFEGHGEFTGEVIEIRLGAKYGLDRRCRYDEDGDEEDLSLDDLIDLENERIVRENSKAIRVTPPKESPASRPCSQSHGLAEEVGQAMEESSTASADSEIPVVDAEFVSSPDVESSIPDDPVAPAPAPPVPSVPLSAYEKVLIEKQQVQIHDYDLKTLEGNSKRQLDLAEQMRKGTVNFYTDFPNAFGFPGDPNRLLGGTALVDELKKFRLACLDRQCGGMEQYYTAHREWEERELDAERSRTAKNILAQPMVVYAREREGKSQVISQTCRAALDLDCAVLVFVAPTKVSPVADTATKLRNAGFPFVVSSNTKDSKNPRAMSRVFVVALNTPRDIKHAHEFIRDHAKEGRPTVAVIDECDELIMGRGTSSVKLDKGGTFQPVLSDDEDSSDSDYDSSDDEEHIQRVAKSEMLFRVLIQPSALLVLVTATHLATYAKQISFFDMSKPATFLRARKSEEYVGVSQMRVPPGLSLSPGPFKGGLEGLLEHPMLEYFASRRNPSDGVQLELNEVGKRTHEGTELPKITLEGSLFVSISQQVNVGELGALNVCEGLCDSPHLRAVDDGQPSRRPLVICFIGNPQAFTTDEESISLPKGATLKEMVKSALDEWAEHDFTHIIFVGYTLTRRSMTATFDLDGKLITPCYAILAAPKSAKIDATSQRVMRAGHEFGLYSMPKDYEIHVACDPNLIKTLQRYRNAEDEAFEKQRTDPKPMKEFIENLPIFQHGLGKQKVSKAAIPLSHLDADGRRLDRISSHALREEHFLHWLENTAFNRDGEKYQADTIRKVGQTVKAAVSAYSNNSLGEQSAPLHLFEAADRMTYENFYDAVPESYKEGHYLRFSWDLLKEWCEAIRHTVDMSELEFKRWMETSAEREDGGAYAFESVKTVCYTTTKTVRAYALMLGRSVPFREAARTMRRADYLMYAPSEVETTKHLACTKFLEWGATLEEIEGTENEEATTDSG